MASTQHGLAIGPLASTLEVVVFVALTGMAWFNGAELLCTILFTFKRWTGRYFYCLLVATFGVLVYQINVFLMIFAPHLNGHGVIACIGIGWSAMVTGQSLVLWSLLHLVCRSVWNLRLMLCMIIFDGLTMHGPQFIFSLLAVKNNAIDPTYRPFELMEKISVAVLSVQEVIISAVYLAAAVRILRIGENLQRRGNHRRIRLLLLTNVVIVCIEICTITLEYMAFWVLWFSFKGFGYSVKLKVEFAILNQLRDSISGGSNTEGSYDLQMPIAAPDLSVQDARCTSRPSRFSLKRQKFEHIKEIGCVVQTPKTDTRHNEGTNPSHWDESVSAAKPTSSEIELLGREA